MAISKDQFKKQLSQWKDELSSQKRQNDEEKQLFYQEISTMKAQNSEIIGERKTQNLTLEEKLSFDIIPLPNDISKEAI